MSDITILVPDDADMYIAAKQALALGMHLITNGQKAAISPVIPEGWWAEHVGFKEPKPCAA